MGHVKGESPEVKKVLLTELIAVLLLVLVMVLLLSNKRTREVPLAEVDAAFSAGFSTEGMEKAGEMRFKRAFGLNAADYQELLYYTPDNTMSVNEYLLLRVKDEAQLTEIRAGIERRLETQKKNFDGYGTDQTELLNKAKIWSAGPYIAFIVSREADAQLDFTADMLEEPGFFARLFRKGGKK